MYKDTERELEEAAYEAIAQEIRSGTIKDGLWLKATVIAKGNDAIAKTIYAELRVAQFKREAQKSAEIAAEQRRNAITKTIHAQHRAAKIKREAIESAEIAEKKRTKREDLIAWVRQFLEKKKCALSRAGGIYLLHEPNGNIRSFNTLVELVGYVKANW